MGKDLFVYLPPEIIIDIFSRLPFRTIMSCKCVCKSWLDLIKTTEFVNSHISKSVPVVILSERHSLSKGHQIVEFVEGRDLNCRLNVVFNLEIPFDGGVHSSVNGFLFCCPDPNYLFVCNPITREYISLDPPKMSGYRPSVALGSYGFGVSRTSGQYKLVRLFFEIRLRKPVKERFKQVECKVYTVGTGSWRRIVSPTVFHCEMNAVGAFLNGNLHWLTRDSNAKGYSARVSCLDLETELFSSFSTPIDHCKEQAAVYAIGDCLYLCHVEFRRVGCDVHFWLMKEYGNEKSWTKLFNISRNHKDFYGCRLVNVFSDGYVLIDTGKLFYYSNKTKTIRKVDASAYDCNFSHCRTVVYSPSFVPLRNFSMEKVRSFRYRQRR